MFGGGKHPLKPLPAGARSRFARPIPWGHLLVPSPFVVGPDRLFDLRISDHQEPPACMFPPLGAHTPASRILRISSFGTGSGLSRRIERVVLMISNRSVLLAVSSGIAYPFLHVSGTRTERSRSAFILRENSNGGRIASE